MSDSPLFMSVDVFDNVNPNDYNFNNDHGDNNNHDDDDETLGT